MPTVDELDGAKIFFTLRYLRGILADQARSIIQRASNLSDAVWKMETRRKAQTSFKGAYLTH